MASFFEFLFSQKNQIIDLTMQHMTLTFIAIIIAILIGIPLGILISRVNILEKPIIGLINLVQAIPSMALLGLLIPILGIGSVPAISMVVVYSLLPIVKNTYTGLSRIDPVILESATGIGLTKNQILFKIQLPLALPMIMSGVRISAVTSVGLMTLSAFIGAGGLGYLVFSGVQTVNNKMILAGAIPACILALIVDYVFGKIEVIVIPKGLNIKKSKNKFIGLKIIGTTLVLLLGFSIVSSAIESRKEKIVVGSKNFTEQLILGNMFALLIERNTEYEVERKFNLGGSSVAISALKNNEIDVYPDYTGTLLLNVMKEKPIKDSEKAYQYINQVMNEQYGLKLGKAIGFNNAYNLGVTKELAEKYNLKSITDLIRISEELIFTPTLEFENREDGLIGLEKVYDIKFKEIKAMDGSLRYTALKNNECQVIDAFGTDGLLKKFDLMILEDDKNFFSSYDAIPIFNKVALEKYPELYDVLNSLENKINESKMIELNYEVDEKGRSPEDVAEEFLINEGVIR